MIVVCMSQHLKEVQKNYLWLDGLSAIRLKKV